MVIEFFLEHRVKEVKQGRSSDTLDRVLFEDIEASVAEVRHEDILLPPQPHAFNTLQATVASLVESQ